MVSVMFYPCILCSDLSIDMFVLRVSQCFRNVGVSVLYILGVIAIVLFNVI